MLPVSKRGWIKQFADSYTATYTTEQGVTCLGPPTAVHRPGHRSTPLTTAQISHWDLSISVFFWSPPRRNLGPTGKTVL